MYCLKCHMARGRASGIVTFNEMLPLIPAKLMPAHKVGVKKQPLCARETKVHQMAT